MQIKPCARSPVLLSQFSSPLFSAKDPDVHSYTKRFTLIWCKSWGALFKLQNICQSKHGEATTGMNTCAVKYSVDAYTDNEGLSSAVRQGHKWVLVRVWLWWRLPHRLSTHQSLSTTLFRITLNRTIKYKSTYDMTPELKPFTIAFLGLPRNRSNITWCLSFEGWNVSTIQN